MNQTDLLEQFDGLARKAVRLVLSRRRHTCFGIASDDAFDDMFQVARLAILQHAPTFNGEGSIEAFLAQRVRWALLDFVRLDAPLSRHHWSHVKSGRDAFALFDESAIDAHHSVPPVERDVIGLTVLADAVRRSKPRDARVLRMRYVDDMTHEDIAAAIGVSACRVSQLLSRAIRRLKVLLETRRISPKAASRQQAKCLGLTEPEQRRAHDVPVLRQHDPAVRRFFRDRTGRILRMTMAPVNSTGARN